MRMKRSIWVVLALCFCVVMLTVSAFADNYGGEDNFGVLGGETTTAPDEIVTDGSTTVPGTTAPEETDTDDVTTEPATTVPDETDTSEGTTEPEQTGTEETTVDSVTTEPDASESETQAVESTVAQGNTTVEKSSESETQPAGENQSGLPWPVILAAFVILGGACVALVVVLLIKYFRAQKQ